jgi:hypothetical protein
VVVRVEVHVVVRVEARGGTWMQIIWPQIMTVTIWLEVTM